MTILTHSNLTVKSLNYNDLDKYVMRKIIFMFLTLPLDPIAGSSVEVLIFLFRGSFYFNPITLIGSMSKVELRQTLSTSSSLSRFHTVQGNKKKPNGKWSGETLANDFFTMLISLMCFSWNFGRISWKRLWSWPAEFLQLVSITKTFTWRLLACCRILHESHHYTSFPSEISFVVYRALCDRMKA